VITPATIASGPSCVNRGSDSGFTCFDGPRRSVRNVAASGRCARLLIVRAQYHAILLGYDQRDLQDIDGVEPSPSHTMASGSICSGAFGRFSPCTIRRAISRSRTSGSARSAVDCGSDCSTYRVDLCGLAYPWPIMRHYIYIDRARAARRCKRQPGVGGRRHSSQSSQGRRSRKPIRRRACIPVSSALSRQ